MRSQGLVSVIVAGLVLGAAACSLPDTSQRGFGSRQVMHVRDPNLGLRSFSLDTSAIYLARTVPNIMTSNDVSAPYDRTLLDLASGTERPIAVGVMLAQLLPDAVGSGRSLVMVHFSADGDIPPDLTLASLPPVTLTFLDEVTGTALDVTNVDSQYLSFGDTRSDPILVGRPDANGDTQPWVGPPEALVPLPPEVRQVVGRDHLGFIALTAASGDTTQAFTRYPFDPGAPPAVVAPGVLGAHTTITSNDGSVPNTAAASIPRSDVSPAIVCPAPPAAAPAPPCLLFYNRTFADGSEGGFVRFLDDTREDQLPGMLDAPLVNLLRVSPGGSDLFYLTPQPDGPTESFAWHVGDDHAPSCVVPGMGGKFDYSQAAWQPNTGQFASIAQTGGQSASSPGSWNLIEGSPGAGCQVVASGANLISQLLYSPDGKQMALLESDTAGASTVYLAGSDGSAPAVAAAGDFFFNIDFHDARHLLLWHSSTDGYSLSWLDASLIPATEHPIADRVRWDARGSWAWLTPTWVLLADADLDQDGSYSLNVVNIDTGEERLVSAGVIDFRVSWNTPPPGATELVVVYTVRSRSASSQDGVWVAHIPLAQFI